MKVSYENTYLYHTYAYNAYLISHHKYFNVYGIIFFHLNLRLVAQRYWPEHSIIFKTYLQGG